jgi:outer membrane protein OmpA-like peptidoglycan-associated protein
MPSNSVSQHQQPEHRTQTEQPTESLQEEAGKPVAALSKTLAGGSQLSPAAMMQLQRMVGNQTLQRLVLQRQVADAPTVDAGTDTTAPQPNPALDAFLRTRFGRGGTRFDMNYDPTGGSDPAVRPINGHIEIVLNLHINFKNFDQRLRRQEPYNTFRFTREQLRDFNWTADQRTRFSTDLVSSIQTAWSDQHRFVCTTPGFEEVSAGLQVRVNIVDDEARAHTKITALKIPEGAPRFRSFVQGDEATLDYRDPTETEFHDVTKPQFVRQVGPFATGSAELTPDITAQLDGVIAELRNLQQPGQQAQGLGPNLVTVFRGRASTPGTRSSNQKLAAERARNVEQYVNAQMGWTDQQQARGAGEENATDEERFKRVDIEVVNLNASYDPVEQNTAAHEAGHMFGLDDEYEDLEAHRLTGDRPDHYGDVEAELGADAANELLAGDSGSMMSVGSTVARGHYVPFLQALESSTSKEWTIPG